MSEGKYLENFYLQEISYLKDLFALASNGNFSDRAFRNLPCPFGLPGLFLKSQWLDIGLKFLLSLQNDVRSSHLQALNNLVFIKFAFLWGSHISGNQTFWRSEIQEDLKHSENLCRETKGHLQLLSTGCLSYTPLFPANTDSHRTLQEIKQNISFAKEDLRLLVSAFDSIYRKIPPGSPGLHPSEGPYWIDPENASTLIQAFRKEQMIAAREHAKILMQRATLCLQKSRFIATEMLPKERKDDPASVPRWEFNLSTSINAGKALLAQALSDLTDHAARHRLFPDRLGRALTMP